MAIRVCEGTLRNRLTRGDLLLFSCLTETRNGSTIEIFHDAGYDAVLLDREHTAFNDETISDQIRIARCLGFPCMVRVSEDSYSELNRTLDQGADGVFIPRIVSREQVEKIVHMTHYSPRGNRRGLGSFTSPASKYHGWTNVNEMIDTTNKNIVIGIQIETAEAVENLDAILSVKGVDIALVGGDDLSLGLGIPGQSTNPIIDATIERVIETCKKYGVVPGVACGDPERIKTLTEKGVRVFWCANDVYCLWQAAKGMINKLNKTMDLKKYGSVAAE